MSTHKPQELFEQKTETRAEYKKPKLYAVLIYNDNYTTMDFVVDILMNVFHKSSVEATTIMLNIHERGRGIAGTYTFDIAQTKKVQAEQMAELESFPLKITIEEASQ